MRYLGGKSRVAKHLKPFLEKSLVDTNGVFVEPFVGGFNLVPTLEKSLKTAVCADSNESLISLYKGLQKGWEPPSYISEEDYYAVKAKNDVSDPLTAFVSFGCSFGGKEWGGFARASKGDIGKSYAAVTKRSLEKKFDKVKNLDLNFVCSSYTDLTLTSRSTVYCDPPYRGTTGYRGVQFDNGSFESWCETKVCEGHNVFVSEFSAPEHWECVWRKERRVMVSHDSEENKVECLFKVVSK